VKHIRLYIIIFVVVSVGTLAGGIIAKRTSDTWPPDISIKDDPPYDIITIPVILHPVHKSGTVSTIRTDAEILTLFKNTNEIWAQASIAFDAEIEEVSLPENIESQMEFSNYGAIRTHIPANDNKIHVLYINHLFGANGWAVPPRYVLVADVTTVDDFRATAHEIGHILGLDHTEDSDILLMATGRNGQLLTTQEITRARKTANQLFGR
jgi:hypothetical protein